MHSRLFQAKQWTYRFGKYLMLRSRPWSDPDLQGQNVVVVGSAPTAGIPDGFDETYRVLTVNASQQTSAAWGVTVPYATIMMFNQIEGTNTNAREVRRVLHGARTGHLYLMLWRKSVAELEAGLRAFDYGYEHLDVIDRYRRVALVRAVTGELNFELDASTKYSNGLISVLLALHSGARNVIISGINPNSSGHAYNNENLPRLHVSKDLTMLRQLRERGRPVYTADAEVAEATGLPLWKASLAISGS